MLIHPQPRNWAEARTFLSATPPETPNSGGGNEAQRRSSADVLTQYGNDAVRMADRVAALEGENYRYREQRRELQDEVKALKANQRPEGATILTGDEATAYDAYKALGKPAEIKTRLDERDTLATEVTTAKRDGTLRDAAQRYGYDYDALRAHSGDLALTAQEVEEDGKRVTKYRAGEGTAQTDLAEWVAKQPAYVGRALAVADTQQGQQAGGVRYPAQGSGEHRPASTLDDFIARRNEQAEKAHNPLAPVTP